MHKKSNLRLLGIRLFSVGIDLLTIASSVLLLTLLRKALGGEFDPELYFRLWPFLILFWLVFEKLGLYNGTSLHSGACLGPVEEFRRIFYALAAVFIVLGFGNYCYRPDNYLYSRSILIGSFILCLTAVPAQRILFRKLCTRFGWWGIPAIIIGSGETARRIFENLNRHSEYGLTPIGYFTDNKNSQMPDDAVRMGTLEEISSQAESLKIKYAILAKDNDVNSPNIQSIISQYGTFFPHLLIVLPSLLNTCSGVTPKDLGGTLGLEIRHNLQIPSTYRIKRMVDFLLTIPCLIVGLPVMGLIAIWIKADSPGPVFFKHRRITKNEQPIRIYKFRTMMVGADEELNDLLRENPKLKHEFNMYGKLENDPRITRVGKWLRKTSLDELPQLFNVLQGRLTLVGPRPIVKKELAIYGESADLFNRVLPGITGLWQVSGRNELTYAERARLDNYYANNWSVWLDLYILSKTVFAVLFRRGAR